MQYPIGSPTCWDENNTNCAIKDAQCSYGCVNRSGVEIKAMANYDKGMRLLINQGITSRGRTRTSRTTRTTRTTRYSIQSCLHSFY